MGLGNSTANFVSALATSNDEGVKEVAAEKLCAKVKQYTQHESYVKAVTKNAGKPLVVMLEKGSDKGKQSAAATLSYLALNTECKVQLAEFGAIPALVKVSKEGNQELQGAAAAGLANMASRSPANQAALASAGAIPPLVAIVKTGLSEARGWAASALGNIANQNKKNQQRIAEAGGIAALVELTVPQPAPADSSASSSGFDLIGLLTCRKRAPKPTSKNRELAARALSQLMYDCAENQEKALKAGCVQACLSLAREGSPSDEVEAFRALSILWGPEPKGKVVKEKIISEGGLKVFLEMVRNASDDSKAGAAGLLGRLAHGDANVKASIATSGGIQALVELGQNGGPQAKVNAAKALKELAADCPENEKHIAEAGGAAMLETFRNGMKFRELNAEEEARFQDAQKRANALREGNGEAAEQDPTTDPNRDPNKPLCFK